MFARTKHRAPHKRSVSPRHAVTAHFGGGIIGALPGLLVAGPLGAAVGAVVGAAVGNAAKNGDPSEQDIARFLLRYYRKSSTGVTYIELTHR